MNTDEKFTSKYQHMGSEDRSESRLSLWVASYSPDALGSALALEIAADGASFGSLAVREVHALSGISASLALRAILEPSSCEFGSRPLTVSVLTELLESPTGVGSVGGGRGFG